MSNNRSNFSNKLGFVLAAAGSAVGLGNIWRFPYLAAKYGGGTFLLCYLVLAVTFGFALMTAEIAIGRKTGLSAIGAFKALDKRFGFLGVLAAVVPTIIFPYYCVIGGWVTKYFSVYISGQGQAAASDEYFGSFIGTTGMPLVWMLVFILLTAAVVFAGVEKGIETVSRILMPLLIVLSIGIAGYCLTLDGAMEGVLYYIKPNLDDFSPTTVLAALGQLFYSMSLAMGIMITYGSYMKKDNHLEGSVRQIEIFDTAIAFLAGLMIIPAVFVFSEGDKAALGKGPSLMFVTLPKVFENMKMGGLIGGIFFLLVFFAALTSAISLMETVVSIVQDKLGWKRPVSCLAVTLFSVALAIPSSLGFGVWSGVEFAGMSILDMFDFLSNSVIMPIVAFCTCIFVGYIVKPKAIIEEVERTGPFKSKKMFVVMMKYIAPLLIIAILVSSILDAFNIFNI